MIHETCTRHPCPRAQRCLQLSFSISLKSEANPWNPRRADSWSFKGWQFCISQPCAQAEHTKGAKLQLLESFLATQQYFGKKNSSGWILGDSVSAVRLNTQLGSASEGIFYFRLWAAPELLELPGKDPTRGLRTTKMHPRAHALLCLPRGPPVHDEQLRVEPA